MDRTVWSLTHSDRTMSRKSAAVCRGRIALPVRRVGQEERLSCLAGLPGVGGVRQVVGGITGPPHERFFQ